MSKWTKATGVFSRLWQWLERSMQELKQELLELGAEFSSNRTARRERRKSDRLQKKNRHRMRRAIFGRQLLRMAIFTAVFWGFVWLCQTIPDLYDVVERVIAEIFLILPGSQYLSEVPTILIWSYVIIMVVWPMIALFRTSDYLDSVYAATDSLLDRSNEPQPLPTQISDLDMKLRGIRLSIIQSEQTAREAEQRKNDLVVYLAHDLKTPLSSVIGYLTLLDELPDLPIEQRAKYTSITLDKAYRLEQLINEFFEITRFNLQTIELENNRIDISMMLMQLADEFYPVLEEKKLTIKLTVPPRLIMTGDSDKLMRVFDNLLRNAVSYSYEDTDIRLVARNLGKAVEVTCRNVGDQIPPQSLERLFEKFFRVDSARHSGSGGSGLGLAIAKHIIELHNGEITAESTPQYTQFRIVLPMASEREIVRKL